VSFIHSLAFTFGARHTIPGTGVLLNNRLGRGAYLIEGHPNAVRPRRKPLHTLNAWVADQPTRGLRHVGNCPGGDGQVQWNLQVLSNLVVHGDDPQRAVALPRFTVFPGSDADVVGRPPELRCETGIPEATLAGLAARGHDVRRLPPPTRGWKEPPLPSEQRSDLPDRPKPQGRYVAATATDGLVLTAGMTPRIDGTLQHVGRVGREVSLDEARHAARIAVSNALAAAADEVGGQAAIIRALRLVVFVNAADGFTQHSVVADAASERLVEVLGDRGIVVRTAVGVASLPGGACLEVELTCQRG
jgi:enamine deaminase RidA (YjgF/YER057c/UK114 family)